MHLGHHAVSLSTMSDNRDMRPPDPSSSSRFHEFLYTSSENPTSSFPLPDYEYAFDGASVQSSSANPFGLQDDAIARIRPYELLPPGRGETPTPPLSRVPIPRLPSLNTRSGSRRVSRACKNCRQHKAKCDGQQPSCQRCQEASIRCVYDDTKREKAVKCAC